jgi:c-di-GMP-binding flagellar brake protein YcgR
MTTAMASETKYHFTFEDMNLQVGGRLQFITYRTVKPIQHFSTLIGYVKDEYLIVKIPMEGNAPITLADGEKLTIRVFSGVNVCSFAGTVLRIFGRPLNSVYLSFPTAIQGTSLRAAMRVKVDIPARITPTREGADARDVAIVNLSVTGALIESAEKLAPEDAFVMLRFTLLAPPHGHEVVVDTRAAVKNVSVSTPPAAAEGQAEVFTYGLQFNELELAHYSLLQNITYEALIADRQKIV